MRHSFIITTALMAASAAQAGEPTNDELCAGWGRLAAKVMELRQMDAPMSDLMKDADNKEIAEAQRAVIVAAYNEPSYMSKVGKRKAVDAFRNKIELDCYNAN